MSIGGGEEYGERGRTSEDDSAYDHAPGRLTTRTRLPDGEGGSGRQPVRPGRSLITVVGVVVLLIAAIAFANRGGSGDSGTGDRADDSEQDPNAQPTAPTGENPVKGSQSGIASDFPHTRQGAQSAAANYAVALVSSDIIKPGKRDSIVKQLFVPEQVDKMRAKMDKAYSSSFLQKLGLDKEGNAKKGMSYISRTTPVGTKTTSFSADSAKLNVWCTGLYGLAGDHSKNPVADDWFTMQLDLSWTDSDWKVQGFKQKDGPAPVNGDNKASGADEIAHAVDQYGGFTYAR